MATGFDFLKNSGVVRVSGDIDYNTFVYNLYFDLDQFRLMWLKRHLDEYANITAFDGMLTTDATIMGDFKGDFDYRGSGFFQIEDFKIVDAQRDSFFAFTDLEIELDTFNSIGNFYNISDLKVYEPYLRYALYPEGDNVSTLLKPTYFEADTIIESGSEEVIPGQEYFNVFIYLGQYANFLAKTYSESNYTADSIVINDGTIVFEDYTLNDDVMFLFQEANVTTSKFDSRDEKVTFLMDMEINQSAYFNAEWRVNPQDVLDMDLIYTLQGLTVSSLESIQLLPYGTSVY